MIELNAVQTVAFGGLALFLGYALCRFIPLLGRYNLPPPVIGGLVIALLVLWAHGRDTVLFQFDTALQGPSMVAFFTSMGVNASVALRSEEHTSELQSLMRISSAVFCLKKKTTKS